MSAGDVLVLGPFDATDATAIDTGVTGNGVVVADDITAFTVGSKVMFLIIKAA